MEQFEIKRIIPLELFGCDVSFTNASLFMVIAVVLISGFLILAMSRRSLVPGPHPVDRRAAPTSTSPTWCARTWARKA